MIFCTLDTITSYCRFHLELFQHSFVLIAGHISNQYDTCLWMLVKSGKTLSETQEILKDTQKQQRNELLFQQFGINYKMLPVLFRQGSCLFKTKVIFSIISFFYFLASEYLLCDVLHMYVEI
jgi:tRNA(His) guanylyltransferase